MNNAFDLIISGNVITLSTKAPSATAIAVKEGLIAAVGDVKQLSENAASSTRYLELGTKTILPGLMDTHVHPIEAGTIERQVDLGQATSVTEILAAIQEKARQTATDQPVLAFNFNYDIVQERRLPTIAELDKISTRHPIAVIVYDVHSAQLNSRMLKKLSLKPDGPGIGKDPNGQFTGLLEDPAIAALMRHIQPETSEQVLEAVLATTRQAAKRGITTLHVKELPTGISTILDVADQLPVRVKPMVMVKSDDLSDFEELLNSEIAAQGAVIAMYADGAPDSKTAAFFEPYCGDPSNFGMLYYEDEHLEELLGRAHRKGLQISVHTCGTRATEQVLAVYEKILSTVPRDDHRHRIEHFEMPFGDQIRRAVNAGISLAMQPSFLFLSGEGTFENIRSLLGDERVMRWKPFRSIIAAGGLIAGGSDAPVTPMSPLKGIQACVLHPNPAERITRFQALQLYTVNAARVGFEENLKGTIEPGKLADFTVLAENPFAVDSDRIGDIAVEMTIVGGEVVYSR